MRYLAHCMSHIRPARLVLISAVLALALGLGAATPARSQSSIVVSMEFDYLRPTGYIAFGWIAQDLNPDGACGDASQASAEKGRLTAEHQAEGFVKLLRDMTRFSLSRLA